MNIVHSDYVLEKYFLKDDGIFPNNTLPVLLYKNILNLPRFLPSLFICKLFKRNNWFNSWFHGVYIFHHYHSTTHEVMGICRGKTTLLLGGENGIRVTIEKGDVLILPAGVAHKNLGMENQVKCVGAYPDGRDYDMNYGKPGERPETDEHIKKIPLPLDPIFGLGSLQSAWETL